MGRRWVQVGHGLVEQDHRPAAEVGPRDGEPGAFATGDAAATRAKDRVEAQRILETVTSGRP